MNDSAHGWFRAEQMGVLQHNRWLIWSRIRKGYKLSRKARIKPFNTFSVSTTLGSSSDESSLRKKPNP
jgi:hypothetical protein